MNSDFGEEEPTRSYVPLASGSQVSHYVIIEKIGEGGMGEVYLAEDTRLKRKAALKFLPAQESANRETRARFTREAQAVARLNHPNIVHIYEVGEYAGRPFFASEHIDGVTLRHLIHDREFSSEEVVALALPVCEAMQEAHTSGIIHRDIKPANIIIDRRNRPHLIDFGLATTVDSEPLTRAGTTVGTINYMSPEQIKGHDVDRRSDLFSLGVVLYELLTKHRPFTGKTDVEILDSIQHHTPEPLARYKAGVPDELQRIVSKLLEKDPDMRYQTADDLASDLRRLGATERTDQVPVRQSGKRRLFYVALAALVVVVAASVLVSRFMRSGTAHEHPKKKMLVVLPFENLGSEEDEYFADGITDEITSRLASVAGLGVISRTSAIQYKHTDKSLPQIARELDVDYVLEGTIRWDKSGTTNRVRITPQLINAADNTHLWAHNYERELTQIFQVQSDIASEVVKAIGVELGDRDKQRVEKRPTDNLEAYDLYLRGRARASRSYEEDDFRAAVTLLNQAVAFDSNFVQAWALLAYAHIELYYVGYDHTNKRLDLARDAIERARSINPDDPDVIFAEAIYDYHGLGDYDSALREIAKVIEKDPNRIDSYRLLAAVKRRQGKWDEAVMYHAKVDSLNPRDAREIGEAAFTYLMMRNYYEAEKLYERCIAIAPDVGIYYVFRAEVYLYDYGDIDKARQLLIASKDKLDDRDYRAEMATCDLFDRQYAKVLAWLSKPAYISTFTEDSSDYYRTKGLTYRLMGDSLNSRLLYDSALAYLKSLPQESQQRVSVKAGFANSYGGLGMKKEALQAAQEAVDLAPLSKDAVLGSVALANQAIVLINLGEGDKGLAQLDYCLSIPSPLSTAILKLSPIFDPVRDDPRFQAIIKKYDRPLSPM